MSKREKLTPEEQEQKIEGSFKNLMEQVDKIHRNNREGSIDTRKTYYNAERQFCKFLASEFRLVNVKKLEDVVQRGDLRVVHLLVQHAVSPALLIGDILPHLDEEGVLQRQKL